MQDQDSSCIYSIAYVWDNGSTVFTQLPFEPFALFISIFTYYIVHANWLCGVGLVVPHATPVPALRAPQYALKQACAPALCSAR